MQLPRVDLILLPIIYLDKLSATKTNTIMWRNWHHKSDFCGRGVHNKVILFEKNPKYIYMKNLKI